MHSERLEALRNLDDSQLILSMHAAVRRERAAEIELLYHLIEFDRRRLAVQQGQPSLFEYMRNSLGYPKGPAHRRIASARAIRDFPAVHRALLERRLTLTTTSMLRPILTPGNVEAIVAEASGRTQEYVEEMVARHRPPKEVRDRIQPIAARKEPAAARPDPAPARAEPPTVQPDPPPEIRFKMVLSIELAVKDKFEEVRNLLSGRFPGEGQASYGAVLDAVLEEFLDRHSPERRQARRDAKGARPPADPSDEQRTRYVPPAVRDAVWVRDGGRCTYVGPDGDRCPSRWDLELHHRKAFALGGPTTVEDTCLMCRAHNDAIARAEFGDETVDRAMGRSDRAP